MATLTWGTPQARGTIAATVGASALALLDTTSVNVALPTIGRQLGAGVAGLQWTLNAYTLALASLILLAGSLADRFGRRRIFLTGVVVFTVASLLCAAAPTIGTLIAGRALQGIGAALLTPGSLAILHAAFPSGQRSRAIGTWAGLSGIAAAVGPLVGGLLVDAIGWRAIFWTNVPVAAAVIWLTVRHVPATTARASSTRFDIAGASLATCGLGATTWGLIAIGEHGTAPAVLIALALGGLAIGSFLVWERHHRAPMLPLGLFRARQFSGVNAVTLVVYAGLSGMMFLLVLHLQVSLGYSPLAAGSALLPVTVLMLVLSPRVGALADRIGPRRPMTIGTATMALGLWLLVGVDLDARFVHDILPGLVIFGLGLAAMVTPLTATALAAAPDDLAGTASAVNNAIARTGGLLAVAALPAAAGLGADALADPALLARGYATAVTVCAILVASGAVLSWCTIRDPAPPRGRAASPSHQAGPPSPEAG